MYNRWVITPNWSFVHKCQIIECQSFKCPMLYKKLYKKYLFNIELRELGESLVSTQKLLEDEKKSLYHP